MSTTFSVKPNLQINFSTSTLASGISNVDLVDGRS